MPLATRGVLRTVGQLLLIAALEAVLFQQSSQWLTVGVFVPVSLVAGLGITAMLLTGPSAAIAVAVGMLMAQLQLGREPSNALFMALMYGAQALAAWFILARVFRASERFDHPRDVVALALAGAAAGTVRAVVQVPLLLHESRLPEEWLGFANLSLWVSAMAGVAVFTPAMLAVARGRVFSGRISRMRELLVAMGVGLAVHAAVFLLPPGRSLGMLVFSLGVLPCLAFVAVRGTAAATALMVGIMAVIVMYGTGHGLGPFSSDSFPSNMRLVQTTLAPVGLFMLLLASAEMSRRRAMRALSASKAQLERALEASGAGLWEWHGDSRRNTFDARVGRILGEPWAPGATWSSSDPRGLHPEDQDRLRRAIREHVEQRTSGFEIELRYRRRDGSEAWIVDRGRVMEWTLDGKPLVISGTVTDITQRKRLEEEQLALEARMLQAQKLESLGLLAGGVAHDFNNILTSVLGHADLAMQELPERAPARQHMEQIVAGARSAADLTRQMLAFAGRGRVTAEPLSLPRLVAEMGHLLQVSIKRHSTLRYDFASRVPAVEGDAAQLRQVVMNLILNAAEAQEPMGGAIAVRVREQWCEPAMLASRWMDEVLPAGKYVILEIQDEGGGMNPETLARIFDPFFTTKFTGRGLGLAAVLGIVRGHRGTVVVDTAPERGTTFRVLLPALPFPVQLETPAPAPTSWRGEGVVLVVDDEQAVRTLARTMLERLGFAVVLAADGREGLLRFQERPDGFRMVLMDLTMPGMDGLTAAREIHALRPRVPVVITTGYSTPPWQDHETPDSVAGFLEKPYRLTDLMRVLQSSVRVPASAAAPAWPDSAGASASSRSPASS